MLSFFLFLFFISSCRVKASILHFHVTMEFKTFCNHPTENLRTQTHTLASLKVSQWFLSLGNFKENIWAVFFSVCQKDFLLPHSAIWNLVTVTSQRSSGSYSSTDLLPLRLLRQSAWLTINPPEDKSKRTMNSSNSQQQMAVFSSVFHCRISYYLFCFFSD